SPALLVFDEGYDFVAALDGKSLTMRVVYSTRCASTRNTPICDSDTNRLRFGARESRVGDNLVHIEKNRFGLSEATRMFFSESKMGILFCERLFAKIDTRETMSGVLARAVA